jgi:hypothetical protein
MVTDNGPAVCQWCGFKSRQGKNKKLTALRSNSNTVWFNFQTYIIFSITLVSFKGSLGSSGSDILYGCHLLLDVCLDYFHSMHIFLFILFYFGGGGNIFSLLFNSEMLTQMNLNNFYTGSWLE